jgi:hypothetical protein
MNSEAVSALVAKTRPSRRPKPNLRLWNPAPTCIHRSWGFGQIKSYDDATQRLLIDFKGKKGPPHGPGLLRHHHGHPAGQPPPRPQGDRHQEDQRAHRRKSRPARRRGPRVLPEQRRHRHRDGNHPRAGRRRGQIQEVVVRRQEGCRQGSAHRHPREEDRVLRSFARRLSPPRTRFSSSSPAPAPPAAASRSPRSCWASATRRTSRPTSAPSSRVSPRP